MRAGLKPGSHAGAAVWVAGLALALWVLVIVDDVLDHRLLRFAIKPRQVDGLPGIVISPFLHSSAGHLGANLVPLAILAWLLLISGVREFLLLTIVVILSAGGIDWLVGPSHSTILGASGVVFGWFGYLLARAWFSRSVKWIAVAVLVACVFSTLFTGLLPRVQSHVYWGGHVAAFVAGVLFAALLHRRPDGGDAASSRFKLQQTP